MRGLVDRRAIAILSRSGAPGAYFQRQCFSAGRGRGRTDVEDAPIPEFGAGGSAATDGAGQGLGLGSFGIGRGRGRGNVSPPVSTQPLPPFKPFTLSPAVVAAEPARVPEAEKKDVVDSRYEDAVQEKDVSPPVSTQPLPPFKPFTLSPAVVAAEPARVPEAEKKDVVDSRFGDAVEEKDVSPPVSTQPLPPFKPFTLSPAVVAAEPARVPEAEKKDVVNSRFEDAVEEKDVKPSQSPLSASSEGGGGDLSKVDGGDLSKAGGGDLLSEADNGESKKLLSFRALLNIAPPGDSSQVGPTKIPFNPFNLPTTPSPSIFGGVAGRGGGVAGLGRGAPRPRGEGRGRASPRPSREAPIGAEETPVRVQLSREEARARAMALLAKAEEQASQRRASPPPSPPAPARPQLSREEAVERAVAVMQEGVDRNLSREEERRRRGGAVDSFSDATTMVADRFRRRAAVTSSQQPRGPQSAKDRVKRQPRSFQRRDQEEEPQVPLTLREMTPEDEQRLITLEEEEQFKSSLHSKFLVDFEPEYAMEYFGINPDIDELPQKSLQEILAEAKPFMMIEGMTDAQWDGEVQDVLEKAPHLENLVNLYARPNRLTAREQVSKLQAVADTMPAHVAPEINDFMSQAMLTLQSNPGIRMKEKERLMNKFVSGFSSF